MSRPRFKDQGKNLVARDSATFEKPAIDVNLWQEDMAEIIPTNIIEEVRMGKWINCTEKRKRNHETGKDLNKSKIGLL